MNKHLLVAILLLAGITAQAQECKFEAVGIDRFTKKETVRTRAVPVASKFFGPGIDAGVQRVDTTYSLVVDFNDFGSIKEPLLAGPGSQLFFLLDNDESIELKAENSIQGTTQPYQVNGSPNPPTQWIRNVRGVIYPFTKAQAKSLYAHTITAIRICYLETGGQQYCRDLDVKSKKNQQNLVAQMRCVGLTL